MIFNIGFCLSKARKSLIFNIDIFNLKICFWVWIHIINIRCSGWFSALACSFNARRNPKKVAVDLGSILPCLTLVRALLWHQLLRAIFFFSFCFYLEYPAKSSGYLNSSTFIPSAHQVLSFWSLMQLQTWAYAFSGASKRGFVKRRSDIVSAVFGQPGCSKRIKCHC